MTSAQHLTTTDLKQSHGKERVSAEKCTTRPLHSSNSKETGTQAAKRLTHLSDRSRERLLPSEHWRLVI